MNDPAYAKPDLDYDAGPDTGPLAAPELPIPSAPGRDHPASDPAADYASRYQSEPEHGAPIPVEPPEAASQVPAASFESAPADPAPLPEPSGPGPAPGTAAGPRARPIPRINIQAFCEDPQTAHVLQEAGTDRRLSKAHVTVQMGGVAAAVAFYRNAPTPNLIMVESLHKRDQLLDDLGRLAEVCDGGTKVVVIGHVNDVLLYRELIHRGVSEYLVMPLSVGTVMESISDLYTDPSAEPLGHVIAFIGAKGGVGSSTICHNVAWAITEAISSDVVIADFDLPFGTAGLDFNQDPVQGLADALSSPERVDEVLLDRLLSRCSEHLSLFAAPGTLDQAYDITPSACDTIVDVLRKNVPYIAVDLPHMWTGWARQVATHADHVVITAAPDLANLRNAKNLLEKLVSARTHDNPPYIVLNQVGVAKRPEISAKDFAAALEADIRFVIDFDAALFGAAANNGQMIEEISGKAKAAEQFRELALLLTDRAETKVERPSLLAPILERLNLTKVSK